MTEQQYHRLVDAALDHLQEKLEVRGCSRAHSSNTLAVEAEQLHTCHAYVAHASEAEGSLAVALGQLHWILGYWTCQQPWQLQPCMVVLIRCC